MKTKRRREREARCLLEKDQLTYMQKDFLDRIAGTISASLLLSLPPQTLHPSRDIVARVPFPRGLVLVMKVVPHEHPDVTKGLEGNGMKAGTTDENEDAKSRTFGRNPFPFMAS
jgi:hypothetical protein